MIGGHREPAAYPFSVVGLVQRDDAESLRDVLSEPLLLGADDLARALMVAAEQGNEECGRLLLDAGALPNVHDASGITPLIAACKRNQVAMVRMLVAAGCNVNKRMFRIRACALHWAASYGHEECVRLLLQSGALIEVTTVHGRTPLLQAARADHEDVVAMLLDAGAKATHTDLEKATALHLAAEEGATDCARLLLKAGVAVNARMRSGDTPIMLAAKRGHSAVLRLLMRQIPLDLGLRGHELSAVHWAALGGHVDCLRLLIDHGCSVDVLTERCHISGMLAVRGGSTPLMLACSGGYSMAAEMLLDAGAQPDRLDLEGLTALLYAVRRDSAPCVEVLVRGGACVDGVPSAPGEDTIAPLILALEKNKLAAVLQLLRCGANLEASANSNHGLLSGLEVALSRSNFSAAKLLVAAGWKMCVMNPPVLEAGLRVVAAKKPDTFDWLCQHLYSPPLLSQLSRSVIRDALTAQRLHLSRSLPLPPALAAYLHMPDLEEIGED